LQLHENHKTLKS